MPKWDQNLTGLSSQVADTVWLLRFSTAQDPPASFSAIKWALSSVRKAGESEPEPLIECALGTGITDEGGGSYLVTVTEAQTAGLYGLYVHLLLGQTAQGWQPLSGGLVNVQHNPA